MKNIHSFFISTIALFLIVLSFAPFSFAQNANHPASSPTGNDPTAFFEQINLAIDSARYDRAIRELETWQRQAPLKGRADSLHYAESLRLLGWCNGQLAKYQPAFSNLEKATGIVSSINGRSPAAAKLDVTMAIFLEILGEDEKALAKSLTALEIQEEALSAGDQDFIPTYLTLAHLYVGKGKFQLAEEYAQKAMELTISHFGENHIKTAIAWNMIGFVQLESALLTKAEDSFQKSIAIVEKNYGPSHPFIAFGYNNLGVIRGRQYRFDEALEYDTKALQVRKENFGELHNDVAWSYSNLAWTYYNLNKIKQSTGLHSKALEIRKFVFSPPSPWVAESLHFIGENYVKIGLYNRALKYYNEALQTLRDFYGDQSPRLLDLLNDIGLAYDGKGDAEKYVEFMNIALAIARKEYDENNVKMAHVYVNVATAYLGYEDYETAGFYVKKAQDIFGKHYGSSHPLVKLMPVVVGTIQDYYSEDTSAVRGIALELEKIIEELIPIVGKNNEILAVCNGLIGKYYLKLQDYDQSLLFLKKAETTLLEIFGEADFSNIYEIYDQLSQCYLQMNDFENAKKYNQKHLEMLGFLSNNVTIGELEMPFHIVEGLVTKGEILEKIYRAEKDTRYLQLAEESYQQACNLTHLYRQENRAKKSQSGDRQGDYYAFEKLLSVISQSHQIAPTPKKLNEAWLQMEKAKYNILFEALKKENAVAFGNIPDSLIEKESMISGEIAYYEKLRFEMEKEADSTKTTMLDDINLTLFSLKNEYEALQDVFARKFPNYFALKFSPTFVTITELQEKIIGPDQTLLEYFVGDSSIFIFTVGKKQFDLVEVKKDFPLDRLVQQLQNGLYGYYGQNASARTDALYRQSVKDYVEAARQLYDRLIAPVKDQLTSDLIIVPDGVLGYVPFEALLSGRPKKIADFNAYPFLLKENRFSYCYSATLLREMKEKQHQRSPTKTLIAFAPFYEKSYAQAEAEFLAEWDSLTVALNRPKQQDVLTRRAFSSLPNSGEEVLTASRLWNGDYYLNQDATEAFFQKVAGDYRIVHLSTHGIADPRVGDYSYLAFAEQKDNLENEFLYVRDLYNLQLNADLVVLSACETAAGELQRGEGIISLARAFAYAGAKSILTTLWVVDDAASKDLTKEFYLQLKTGKTKDEALHLAKLKQLRENDPTRKHPFFWAAMIPVGDMSAME